MQAQHLAAGRYHREAQADNIGHQKGHQKSKYMHSESLKHAEKGPLSNKLISNAPDQGDEHPAHSLPDQSHLAAAAKGKLPPHSCIAQLLANYLPGTTHNSTTTINSNTSQSLFLSLALNMHRSSAGLENPGSNGGITRPLDHWSDGGPQSLAWQTPLQRPPLGCECLPPAEGHVPPATD